MAIVGSPNGLRRIILPQQSIDRVYQQLGLHLQDCTENAEAFGDLPRRLQDYFAGKPANFPDDLDWGRATPFQRALWQVAKAIPHGETRSYGWLASQVGKGRAARAVGQAMRSNRWPIVVPCHRVIASNGGLGGFAGGLEMKRRLLELERCAFSQS